MAEPVSAPVLATLLTWFSPAFPVGAFAHSHGLESSIAERWVEDGPTLLAWIRTLLHRGSGWNDLVLLAEGMRRAADDAGLDELDELALALSGSAERRAETLALGTAFAAASAPWVSGSAALAYPVAVARAAAKARLPAPAVLQAYAHGIAANLVSAAVRLIPLGQSEAVRLLHALEPDIAEAAGQAGSASLDDLGSASILSEIAAMRHETLAVRLFRT